MLPKNSPAPWAVGHLAVLSMLADWLQVEASHRALQTCLCVYVALFNEDQTNKIWRRNGWGGEKEEIKQRKEKSWWISTQSGSNHVLSLHTGISPYSLYKFFVTRDGRLLMLDCKNLAINNKCKLWAPNKQACCLSLLTAPPLLSCATRTTLIPVRVLSHHRPCWWHESD